MTADDWPVVHAIYTEGINTGHATFESQAPDWEHFDAGKLARHRHVAVVDDEVVGWIAVSLVSTRSRVCRCRRALALRHRKGPRARP